MLSFTLGLFTLLLYFVKTNSKSGTDLRLDVSKQVSTSTPVFTTEETPYPTTANASKPTTTSIPTANHEKATVTFLNVTVEQFNKTTFKQVVAELLSVHCNESDMQSTNRTAINVTAADVNIIRTIPDGPDVLVCITVSLPDGGGTVAASKVVLALNTSSARQRFQAVGLTLGHVFINSMVSFPNTTTSVSSTLSETPHTNESTTVSGITTASTPMSNSEGTTSTLSETPHTNESTTVSGITTASTPMANSEGTTSTLSETPHTNESTTVSGITTASTPMANSEGTTSTLSETPHTNESTTVSGITTTASTPTTNRERTTVTFLNVTAEQLNETKFKQVVAKFVSAYCTENDACSQSTSKPAVILTAADVNLISITQNGFDVVVDFTVSLPDGGTAVPATAVVMALDNSSVKQDFQDIGLSLGQACITNPTITTASTPMANSEGTTSTLSETPHTNESTTVSGITTASTPMANSEGTTVTFLNVTAEQLNETKFKQVVAKFVSAYCTENDACSQSTSKPAVILTAADVNLISITQNGFDVVVDFTVSLPDGGTAVPATAVVMALDNSSVKQDFQDIGLSLGQACITNPTITTASTPMANSEGTTSTLSETPHTNESTTVSGITTASTPMANSEGTTVTFLNVTAEQLNETKFKQVVAKFVSAYCTENDACSQSTSKPAVILTAADVNLRSITQNGSDVVVDFTVSLPDGGTAVPATAVVMALDTSSVKQDFQDIGLSLGQVSITNPTTSQPTTPSDSDSALTTAGIIGVVVGAVGGVILIIIVIFYCSIGKTTTKVKPSNDDELALQPMKASADPHIKDENYTDTV
ncbi:mucin-5AC-like [Corticium candelabrum]|uniref:mucin-5AC-like n=1 Tax=Corticium candelabrum TaxID=121492 RepID=UPI002E26CC6E|nr:mucin-5AC-like [Corticium candelabrum]